MLKTFLILFSSVLSVQGHGYLKTPRARNYVASVEGKEAWNGGPNDPLKEWDAHSLNVIGPQCGKVGSLPNGNNYDVPRSSTGSVLAPKIQATYTRGQIITVDVKVRHRAAPVSMNLCCILTHRSILNFAKCISSCRLMCTIGAILSFLLVPSMLDKLPLKDVFKQIHWNLWRTCCMGLLKM